MADRIIHEGGGAGFQKKVAALVGTIGQYLLSMTTGALGSGINKVIDRAVQHSEKLQLMRSKMSQFRRGVDMAAGRVKPSSGEEGKK